MSAFTFNKVENCQIQMESVLLTCNPLLRVFGFCIPWRRYNGQAADYGNYPSPSKDDVSGRRDSPKFNIGVFLWVVTAIEVVLADPRILFLEVVRISEELWAPEAWETLFKLCHMCIEPRV